MSTLTSAHDLITAVPFLIGFQPSDSLVLIALHQNEIALAMRIDIPDSLSDDDVELLSEHYVRQGADGALLVAYMPQERSDGDGLLISLGAALMRKGIEIRESIVVACGRYRSIICRDQSCCPATGVEIPDYQGSTYALEHVIAGIPMPYSTIDELVDSISALPISHDRDWRQRIDAYSCDEESPDIAILRRDGVEAMDVLLDEFRLGHGASEDQLVARVIGRMSDVQVRDYALGVHQEDTFDLYFAMWRELLRVAPHNFIAPIACIVAAMAYESGDGALAQKALDRAFEDDGTYPLAALLRRVFNAGWPPQSFAQMRSELHPKVVATIFG
jgi:hypothetical protein